MNPEPVTVRRRVGMGLAVVVALFTSACAAGQQASTANERPTLDGTNGSVGPINLRGLVIEPPPNSAAFYPKGSDLSVKLVLVNTGQETDRLIGITSSAISNWGAYETTADAQAIVDHDTSPSASASATPSESTSATGSGSASSTTSAASSAPPTTALPLPASSNSVPITPGNRTSWGTPESKGALLLLNTTAVLYPGTTVSMTFTFANAGSVTLAVPIGLASIPQSSVVPAPTGSSAEG